MLPELPKQNKKQETAFGLKLREWIEKNLRVTCSMETKDSRGKDYLNFNDVTEGQVNFAIAINSDKGVLIRVTGLDGEPDFVYLRNEPAYIVVKYPRCFCLIDIKTFVLEKGRSKAKSLTSSRAKEIAEVIHSW